MRRFKVYTSWGASFGIQKDMTLVELVNDVNRHGYLCCAHTYVHISAIAGIEDIEMVEVISEASEQGSWQ